MPRPDPRPFTPLAKPRVVPPGLPSDLVAFYARNEGCGLAAEHPVCLAALAEVVPVTAADVPAAPESFAGYVVGRASGAVVSYVRSAPGLRFGTVVAFGSGVGRLLVLDTSFAAWVTRLERWGWVEHGLSSAGLAALKRPQAEALRRHFRGLNPGWEG